MPLIYRQPLQQGMLSRVLSVLILLAAFTISLFLGVVLFLVVLGALVLLFLIIYLRLRWLRRKFRQRPPAGPQGPVILEGEYTVERPAKGRDGQAS